jgi:hypothetical protein
MRDPEQKCRKCGVKLQGRAHYCVSCYRALTRPCHECMVRGRDDVYRVRSKGRPPVPVNCALCRNERYLLVDGGRIVED